jgi:hypothetical protein
MTLKEIIVPAQETENETVEKKSLTRLIYPTSRFVCQSWYDTKLFSIAKRKLSCTFVYVFFYSQWIIGWGGLFLDDGLVDGDQGANTRTNQWANPTAVDCRVDARDIFEVNETAECDVLTVDDEL